MPPLLAPQGLPRQPPSQEKMERSGLACLLVFPSRGVFICRHLSLVWCRIIHCRRIRSRLSELAMSASDCRVRVIAATYCVSRVPGCLPFATSFPRRLNAGSGKLSKLASRNRLATLMGLGTSFVCAKKKTWTLSTRRRPGSGTYRSCSLRWRTVSMPLAKFPLLTQSRIVGSSSKPPRNITSTA